MKETFLADRMLGRLARWVRFMGYHVTYAKESWSDNDIAEKCKDGSSILLSRDRELCNRVEKSVYVTSSVLDEQLRQFASLFVPVKDKIMRICPKCNSDLVDIEKEEVKDHVPEGVYRNAGEFWKCISCGKLYWDGTHYDRIIRKISELTGVQDESSQA